VASTIFGVAITLGLGTLQINSGLSQLADIAYGFTSQFIIIGVVVGLFMISALTPF
jgi:glycine betaine transporter